MYECFHCGCRAVIWDCDFTLEEYGFWGDGLVNTCHCENCGAEILYIIRFDEEEEDGEDSKCEPGSTASTETE